MSHILSPSLSRLSTALSTLNPSSVFTHTHTYFLSLLSFIFFFRSSSWSVHLFLKLNSCFSRSPKSPNNSNNRSALIKTMEFPTFNSRRRKEDEEKRRLVAVMSRISKLIFICRLGLPSSWDLQVNVVQTKSVKYMPPPLSLAGFVNGLIWTAYAFIRFDLYILVNVVQTKSVKYMPLPLSLAGFVNGLIWIAYAFIRIDLYILIGNVIGVGLALVQLILYACYCKATPSAAQQQGQDRKVQLEA